VEGGGQDGDRERTAGVERTRGPGHADDLRLDNMALSLLTGLHENLVSHHAASLDAAQRVLAATNPEDGEQAMREQSSAISDLAVVAIRLVRARFD
jgi:hypothetical protein